MKYGQSTIEYVFLIALVAAAIIGISVYVSRGFQGRLREQADQVGEQYSPKGMDTNIKKTWDFTTNTYSSTEDKNAKTSTSIRRTVAETKVSGHEYILRPLDEEPWRK